METWTEYPRGPVTHVTTTTTAAAAASDATHVVVAGGPSGCLEDRRMPVDATASIKYLGVAGRCASTPYTAGRHHGTPVTAFLSWLSPNKTIISKQSTVLKSSVLLSALKNCELACVASKRRGVYHRTLYVRGTLSLKACDAPLSCAHFTISMNQAVYISLSEVINDATENSDTDWRCPRIATRPRRMALKISCRRCICIIRSFTLSSQSHYS